VRACACAHVYFLSSKSAESSPAGDLEKKLMQVRNPEPAGDLEKKSADSSKNNAAIEKELAQAKQSERLAR
jgi:hypothetical protein